MSKTHWLWDHPQTDEKRAKRILQDENHKLFFIYAALLLSRNDDTNYVFSMLDKRLFCKYWPVFRNEVNKGGWFDQHKEVFWKPIYERTIPELKKQGVRIHEFPDQPISEHRFNVALKLRKIREERGLTQKDAAQYLRVSQQYISKLENGQINISIDKMWEFVNMCVKGLKIDFIS